MYYVNYISKRFKIRFWKQKVYKHNIFIYFPIFIQIIQSQKFLTDDVRFCYG
jgi:hypothetical protein